LRTFGAKVFGAVLVLTGLSVILDQQGIMKGGMSSDIKAQTSLDPVMFSDVEGVDEAKADLEEIVEFLKNPKKYVDIGGRRFQRVSCFMVRYDTLRQFKYLAWNWKDSASKGCSRGSRSSILSNVWVCLSIYSYPSSSEFDEMYVGVGAVCNCLQLLGRILLALSLSMKLVCSSRFYKHRCLWWQEKWPRSESF
jgi:hypothetical protein